MIPTLSIDVRWHTWAGPNSDTLIRGRSRSFEPWDQSHGSHWCYSSHHSHLCSAPAPASLRAARVPPAALRIKPASLVCSGANAASSVAIPIAIVPLREEPVLAVFVRPVVRAMHSAAEGLRVLAGMSFGSAPARPRSPLLGLVRAFRAKVRPAAASSLEASSKTSVALRGCNASQASAGGLRHDTSERPLIGNRAEPNCEHS
jgi:hypothetical protein